VCLSDELESKCTKGCQDGENDSRKKREVKEDYGADLFIGPIKKKEEKDEGNVRKHSNLRAERFGSLRGIFKNVKEKEGERVPSMFVTKFP